MMRRYAPDVVLLWRDGKACLEPVLKTIAHPTGSHDSSPIRNDLVAVELVTSVGSRWYGCTKAYIDSRLRMVLEGLNDRDEVVRKWEVVE